MAPATGFLLRELRKVSWGLPGLCEIPEEAEAEGELT